MRILIAMAMAAVLGGAQSKTPVLLERTEPEYTDAARMAKLQGTALLAVTIGDDGAVRSVRVAKSLGLGLDENAILAVGRWRFAPAPATTANIEVSFHLLLDPRDWYLSRAMIAAPPDASQPTLLKARYRPPAGVPESGAVRISFEVDTQGVPSHLQVEESTDPKWNEEILATVREWRFQPAVSQGAAVASHVQLDFKRGALEGTVR